MAKSIKKIERIPHKVIAKQTRSLNGIVSGTENPASVGCTFYTLDNGDTASCFMLNKWHQGHEEIGHGGIVYSVLDEVMGRSNSAYDHSHGGKYVPVVTGEITVRNVSYAPIGEKLYVYGRVIMEDGRKRFTTGEILKEDGTVIARGKAVFFRVITENLRDNESDDTTLNENDPAEL